MSESGLEDAQRVSPSDPARSATSTQRMAGLAARGSLQTIAGYAFGESLRFASNLLLTRLLFPDAFGAMAVVNALVQGARMLSDLGIRGSIVQHARGEEPAFYNSAWTLQVLRGGAICSVLALSAGWIAAAYGKPELAPLVRVVALATLIDGFASTSKFLLARRVQPGRTIAGELLGRVCGIGATLAWAALSPSVWALAGGALAGALADTLISHRILPGHPNRFAYDRGAVRAIVDYGRWVMIATAMTYLVTQSDRLVLGKLITNAELGVYAIAYSLAQLIPEVTQKLSLNILLPVYARLGALPLNLQRKHVSQYRLAILGASLPLLWSVIALAPWLVTTLYDARYHEAGWMLQILAAGMIPVVVASSADRMLLARGESFAHLLVQLWQALLLVGGIACASAWLGGVRGVIVGVAAGRLLGYVPLAIALRRVGFWLPAVDALAFCVSLLVGGAIFVWGKS